MINDKNIFGNISFGKNSSALRSDKRKRLSRGEVSTEISRFHRSGAFRPRCHAELHTQLPENAAQCGQPRIAVFREGLVQGLAAYTSPPAVSANSLDLTTARSTTSKSLSSPSSRRF